MQKEQPRDTRSGRRREHLREHPRGLDRILNRGTEPERSFFRCGRYFAVGHEWYATTREGHDVGPCGSRQQAELQLAHYLADQELEVPGNLDEIAAVTHRDPTELEVLVQELINCRHHSFFRSENSSYVWAKQRLAKFEENPAEHDHANIRASALRYFLSELDK